MIEIAIVILGLIIIFPFILLTLAEHSYSGSSKGSEGSGYTGSSEGSDLSYLKVIIKRIEGKALDPIYEYKQLDSVKYVENDHIVKMGCHNGQRKLLLTEIEFMSKSPEFIMYAGSAPNEHMPILLSMFPKHKFLLIDPNYHTFNSDYKYVYMNCDVVSPKTLKGVKKDLFGKDGRRYKNAERLKKVIFVDGSTHDVVEYDKDVMNTIRKEVDYKSLISTLLNGSDRIYIIQDYMTPQLTKNLATSLKSANNPECGFISDIRTNMFNPAGPVDLDYVWNDGLQLIFLKTLKPTLSMLKFHPPLRYPNDNSVKEFIGKKIHNDIIKNDLESIKKIHGLDMFKEYTKGKHMYLANTTIYLQTWAPKSSTEARLIITADDLDKPYVNYDYEEWLSKYAYLKYIRGYACFNTYKLFANLSDGYNRLDGCFDCMLEIMILSEYLMKSKSIHLDISAINKWLSSKNNTTEVFKLWKMINNESLYPVDQKGVHGHVQYPPKNIHFYQYQIGDEIVVYEIDDKLKKRKVYTMNNNMLIPVNGYKLNLMDGYKEKPNDLNKLTFNINRSVRNEYNT